MNETLIKRHLRDLSLAYDVLSVDDFEYFLVRRFKLPPGYNLVEMDVLIYLPDDYPLSPPGIGSSKIFVPSNLRYKEKKLDDVHEHINPGWGNWSWFCYQNINWDPKNDNLITLLEMIRMDLTFQDNKQTNKSLFYNILRRFL